MRGVTRVESHVSTRERTEGRGVTTPVKMGRGRVTLVEGGEGDYNSVDD